MGNRHKNEKSLNHRKQSSNLWEISINLGKPKKATHTNLIGLNN